MEIHYKGFSAKLIFSADVDVFYGEVLNVQDLIVFQASTLQSAQDAMRQAIDCYLSYYKNCLTMNG